MSSQAGYSGTPLAKKLGIVEGSIVTLKNAPEDFDKLLAPLPKRVQFNKRVTTSTDIVHIFTVHRSTLETELNILRDTIRPNCAVWVSWPKKASKVVTDITEDTIREVCLPIGFVDIKVCAVSEIWSALKLVIRKELR